MISEIDGKPFILCACLGLSRKGAFEITPRFNPFITYIIDKSYLGIDISISLSCSARVIISIHGRMRQLQVLISLLVRSLLVLFLLGTL